MSTIDETLASGWYTDKRGRRWKHLPLSGRWADQVIDHQGIQWAGQKIEANQMRLLIERDQHRDECPTLAVCQEHPVPFVEKHVQHGGEAFAVIDTTRPGGSFGAVVDAFPTHAEAMDEARALAVES